MKLGIISYDYNMDAFEKIKTLGLDFAEFCVNFEEDNKDKHEIFYNEVQRIKADLSSLSLTTGSVGRWGGYKINKDGTVNPYELDADTKLIKAASVLECPVYVTGCNYAPELSLFENYQAAIGYFEKLIAIGKEYGIKIATCNCRWNNYIVSDPAWSIVHGHLNDLYIKFDPSHCVYAGGEYLGEMKKWAHRFAHVHIKGSLVIDGERFDDPPAGLDQTNWGAFMSMLYAAGYDGTLSIEPHSAIWKDDLGDRGVKYTIDMMRKLML